MRRFLVSLWELIIVVCICYGQDDCHSLPMSKEDSIGAWNAVKKAHQMTDLPIYPVSTLYAHKTYQSGVEEKGLIYSSTKEINTSVGQDISFYTFMTALHNPRSLLYTERIDSSPYHGKNCRAYYGTVCSGLVTYALGFKITQRSADIPVADYMELVKNQDATGVRVADVLWKKGHVMLVTAVEREAKGGIGKIEYCESVGNGCRRCVLEDGMAFNQMLKKRNLKIYRYKYLFKNTSYVPINEFVAVEGETKLPFVYNEDICTSKGDKACYINGEIVVLNVAKGFKNVEIYKNKALYKTIRLGKVFDVSVPDLPYGDYQARAVNGKKKSDYVRWKVIDVNVKIDSDNNKIYFSSANATPVYYEFSDISGNRPTNKNRLYAAEFSDFDRKNGYVRVKAPRKPNSKERCYTYVKVHFESDYGMVINKPINWFE